MSAFPAFHPASAASNRVQHEHEHEHEQQQQQQQMQPASPPQLPPVSSQTGSTAPSPAKKTGGGRKRKAPSDEEDAEPSPSPSPPSSSDDEYDPRAERRQRAVVTGVSKPRAEGSTTLKKGSLECEYCGKKFERMSVLKTHLNCHTGAKPYVCTVEGCDATFGVLSNMYRHVRSHTTPRSSANARRKRTKPAISAAETAASASASVDASTSSSNSASGGGGAA